MLLRCLYFEFKFTRMCVCVCLATLQGWKPPFSLDVEKFSFTPRLQPLNELEVILSVETSTCIYIVHVQVYIHY